MTTTQRHPNGGMMEPHPTDRRYIVHWEDTRHHNHESVIRAFDAIAARAVITRNPAVARIIAVEPA